MKAFRFVKGYFAVAVVAAAFLWSAVKISSYREAEEKPGTITLRIAHWQLEPGVRTGLDVMAADYQKIHPEVHIVQDAIPESTYPQWVSTQLMGGTAPDMVELGQLAPSLLVAYMGRYFLPMTPIVSQPNPYNKGNDLAGTPLRLTYEDGMRDSYVDELQNFMKIPLTQFGMRIFYNKTLLKKLTGLETPPMEYRAFLAACDKIKEQKNERGEAFIPLAGSKYHLNLWDLCMFQQITFLGYIKADLDRNGWVDRDETYIAFKTGRVGMDSRPYAARLKMASEVSAYFQEGFSGLTRDDAVFLFAQNRAVFITTGLWDARGLQEQARGKFELGVADFPIPAPDDPEFGGLMPGPRYERADVGFTFGVTRTSKHAEAAVDFLLFMASREQNEKLNKIAGWLSPIRGSTPDPALAPFKPHLQGVFPALDTGLGAGSGIKWQQLFPLYLLGQISLDDFIKGFNDYYRDGAAADFEIRKEDWQRDAQHFEQLLAGMRATALLAPPAGADEAWLRYRIANTSRQLGTEIYHNRMLSILDAGWDPDATGPYEFSTEARQAIQERIQNGSKKP